MKDEIRALRQKYMSFDDDTIKPWAIAHYGKWLKSMQDEENQPITPCERFFRKYSQGIHYVYNGALRNERIEDFYQRGLISKDEISEAICEMKKYPCPDNVIAYRYVNHRIFNRMLENVKLHWIRRNNIIFDKGFLSTTLTPDAVVEKHQYTIDKHYTLMIFVPKGTPCAYIELIAHMGENELLFPPRTRLRILSVNLITKKIVCIIEV